MNTVNASDFKAHFGHTLDRSEREAVRIRRRGRAASILLSESAYADLVQRASRPPAEVQAALERLRELKSNAATRMDLLDPDARTQALLAKHLGDRR